MGFSFLRIRGFGMGRAISSLMLFARLRCASAVSHAPSISKIVYIATAFQRATVKTIY